VLIENDKVYFIEKSIQTESTEIFLNQENKDFSIQKQENPFEEKVFNEKEKTQKESFNTLFVVDKAIQTESTGLYQNTTIK
jgi:hypothetical protein